MMPSSIALLLAVFPVVSSSVACPDGKCSEQAEEDETTLLSMNIQRPPSIASYNKAHAQAPATGRPTDDSQYKSLYSESGKFCKGIPQIDSLGAPVNPDASPVCWQIRLSEQKRRMEPRVTYNSKREKFPNDVCKKKLGAEYDFYNPRDQNIYDFTAKSTGQRVINVGAYDPAGMCAFGQLGNPNCCNWTGNARLDYDKFPHLCWRWPNNIPWDGTLLSSSFTDQLPFEDERVLEGFAQQAGCKGGTGVVPGTNQTWCENANSFWKVGCQNLNDMDKTTDCGLHPQASQYVYQMPPFSQGDGDGSEFFNKERAAGIYAAGQGDDHPTYKRARLAPVGTKFGDAQTTDGKNVERDDYGWAMKQMHGKGYGCINARVKMLDECEEKYLNDKGIKTMPPRRHVGIFSKCSQTGKGKQWPALLRIAGNRNHTVYDWHDIRVNGFAIKLYEAQDVTGENGENRVNIADIPRSDYADGPAPITPPYDKPGNGYPYDTNYEPYGIPDAKKGFKGNLSSFQNVTTMDFLFVAIRGQFQGPVPCNQNSPECLYNVFPAGGNGRCYSPMFLYGYGSPADQDHCNYPEGENDTHATWNPLNYTYGSSAALMLGNDNAFKMMVQPCGRRYSDDGVNYWQKITNTVQDPADPNFKANNMNETLKSGSFQFCIFAQIQENPCEQPIEDATVKWNTAIRLTGRIYIEAGVTALYNQVCDNTVFNPYRALTSHMPIGSLQRIRQAVYAYAAQFRLYRNHAKPKSPDEQFASELPLRQPNSDKEPQTPPPREAPAFQCPLGF